MMTSPAMATPDTRAHMETLSSPMLTMMASTPRERWIQPQLVRSNANA
ncbi:hypothetical protein AB0J81_18895 [Streptomyces bobili]